MYGDRRDSDSIAGLHKFIDVAKANKVDNFMPCPCLDCWNVMEHSVTGILQSHLLWRGFMPGYYCWAMHGERGVRLEENEEEEDDDSYPMSPEEYGDTAMEDNKEEGGGNEEEQQASDEPADGLGWVILDAKQQCDTGREKLKLEAMQKDHKKLLYPNCEDGSTKLGTTLELLKWKAEAGLSDKGFEKLLKIMKPKLPKDNELPETTYEAKKTICPLGLDVEKIHACINDCILYRGEKYENMDKCPVCIACWYKIRQDDLVMLRVMTSPPGRGFLLRLCGMLL
jgi:hypothetical protein